MADPRPGDPGYLDWLISQAAGGGGTRTSTTATAPPTSSAPAPTPSGGRSTTPTTAPTSSSSRAPFVPTNFDEVDRQRQIAAGRQGGYAFERDLRAEGFRPTAAGALINQAGEKYTRISSTAQGDPIWERSQYSANREEMNAFRAEVAREGQTANNAASAAQQRATVGGFFRDQAAVDEAKKNTGGYLEGRLLNLGREIDRLPSRGFFSDTKTGVNDVNKLNQYDLRTPGGPGRAGYTNFIQGWGDRNAFAPIPASLRDSFLLEGPNYDARDPYARGEPSWATEYNGAPATMSFGTAGGEIRGGAAGGLGVDSGQILAAHGIAPSDDPAVNMAMALDIASTFAGGGEIETGTEDTGAGQGERSDSPLSFYDWIQERQADMPFDWSERWAPMAAFQNNPTLAQSEYLAYLDDMRAQRNADWYANQLPARDYSWAEPGRASFSPTVQLDTSQIRDARPYSYPTLGAMPIRPYAGGGTVERRNAFRSYPNGGSMTTSGPLLFVDAATGNVKGVAGGNKERIIVDNTPETKNAFDWKPASNVALGRELEAVRRNAFRGIGANTFAAAGGWDWIARDSRGNAIGGNQGITNRDAYYMGQAQPVNRQGARTYGVYGSGPMLGNVDYLVNQVGVGGQNVGYGSGADDPNRIRAQSEGGGGYGGGGGGGEANPLLRYGDPGAPALPNVINPATGQLIAAGEYVDPAAAAQYLSNSAATGVDRSNANYEANLLAHPLPGLLDVGPDSQNANDIGVFDLAQYQADRAAKQSARDAFAYRRNAAGLAPERAVTTPSMGGNLPQLAPGQYWDTPDYAAAIQDIDNQLMTLGAPGNLETLRSQAARLQENISGTNDPIRAAELRSQMAAVSNRLDRAERRVPLMQTRDRYAQLAGIQRTA